MMNKAGRLVTIPAVRVIIRSALNIFVLTLLADVTSLHCLCTF